MSNIDELTKGGQPATASGPLGPGQQYGKDIADALDAKDKVMAESIGPAQVDTSLQAMRRATLIEERGMVAFETAIALGYGRTNAFKFKNAAENAARVGLAPSGIIRSAGRVSIGTVKTFGGVATVMSILLDSGAYYDPTRVTSPGNNSVGSD